MFVLSLFWIIGSFFANTLAEIAIAVILTETNPSYCGIIYSSFHLAKLNIPKRYKKFNFYFSILLSWGLFAIAFAVISGIMIYRRIKN